jgi:hypothetical protein
MSAQIFWIIEVVKFIVKNETIYKLEQMKYYHVKSSLNLC